jgi:antitoxin ParD1/3/4
VETAEKLSITVTPAMARMIREKVEAGDYGSASEVIRAALRAFKREEDEHAERLSAIKARITASVNDGRPPVPLDEAFDGIKERLAKRIETSDDKAARRRSQ